jgi:hypothetical protein
MRLSDNEVPGAMSDSGLRLRLSKNDERSGIEFKISVLQDIKSFSMKKEYCCDAVNLYFSYPKRVCFVSLGPQC